MKNKIKTAVVITNTGDNFITEEHPLRDTALKFFEEIEKNNLPLPKLKIDNESIKMFWHNDKGDIDIKFKEENFYKYFINIEEKYAVSADIFCNQKLPLILKESIEKFNTGE